MNTKSPAFQMQRLRRVVMNIAYVHVRYYFVPIDDLLSMRSRLALLKQASRNQCFLLTFNRAMHQYRYVPEWAGEQ